MTIDVIEDVIFDVDIDGEGVPCGTLFLEGDFVSSCERYLDDADATKIALRLHRGTAEKLVEILSRYL